MSKLEYLKAFIENTAILIECPNTSCKTKIDTEYLRKIFNFVCPKCGHDIKKVVKS